MLINITYNIVIPKEKKGIEAKILKNMNNKIIQLTLKWLS